MLVVGERAMGALAAPGLGAFKRQLVNHIAATLPGRFATLGKERVRALVGRGVDMAEPLGFRTGAETARYVALCVAAGGDLTLEPHRSWAGPVLGDATLSADEKLSRLACVARRRGHTLADEAAP